MSNRFKMFLKGFNLFMAIVLVISTLGVLPSALTSEQVQAAEKVLPNGKYQTVVGETQVFEYQKDTHPRHQTKTTIEYQRPVSPKKMPIVESVGLIGWIAGGAKKVYDYVAPVVDKVIVAPVKKYVAPIVKAIVTPIVNVAQNIWTGAQNVWHGVQNTVQNVGNWFVQKQQQAAQAWTNFKKKQAKKRAAAKKKAAQKKKERAKRKEKGKMFGWIDGFKKGVKNLSKKLNKSMNKQLSKIGKAFKGLGKIERSSAAKALKKSYDRQFNKIKKLTQTVVDMGRNAAKYSAKSIKKQLKRLKKMQKNMEKRIAKKARQAKKFLKKKAKQARVLKQRAADKLKKASSWAYKGLKSGAKRLGKAVEVSANWAKSQKNTVLKGADIIGDFIGAKDAYILVTGKDWHGNKRSRAEAAMWLAVGFTPAGKVAKGAKIAGKAVVGSKAAKAVTKNIKVNPALRGSYKNAKFKLGQSRQTVKKIVRKVPQPVKTVWVVTQKIENGQRKFVRTPLKIVRNQIVKKTRVIHVSKKAVQKAKKQKQLSKGTKLKYPLADATYAKKHMVSPKGQGKKKKLVTTSGGVSGAHNQDEFYRALNSEGYFPDHVKIVERPVPGQPGLVHLEYSLAKQKSGGGFTTEYTEAFSKTIYDPKKWSDTQIFNLGTEAMLQGKVYDKNKIFGTAKNGMKFKGYLDGNGKIRNFHPMP